MPLNSRFLMKIVIRPICRASDKAGTIFEERVVLVQDRFWNSIVIYPPLHRFYGRSNIVRKLAVRNRALWKSFFHYFKISDDENVAFRVQLMFFAGLKVMSVELVPESRARKNLRSEYFRQFAFVQPFFDRFEIIISWKRELKSWNRVQKCVFQQKVSHFAENNNSDSNADFIEQLFWVPLKN